jgi:hypothetical protein
MYDPTVSTEVRNNVITITCEAFSKMYSIDALVADSQSKPTYYKQCINSCEIFSVLAFSQDIPTSNSVSLGSLGTISSHILVNIICFS